MCVSMIEQLQLALSAVVLLRVEQIGNLSIVSIIPSTFRGRAHNYLYFPAQLLPLPSLQISEQIPAPLQDM